jgi:hypothetical protein
LFTAEKAEKKRESIFDIRHSGVGKAKNGNGEAEDEKGIWEGGD